MEQASWKNFRFKLAFCQVIVFFLLSQLNFNCNSFTFINISFQFHNLPPVYIFNLSLNKRKFIEKKIKKEIFKCMNNGMKQGNSLEGNGIRSSWEHLGGDCGPWFMFLSIGKSVSSFPFFIAFHCSIAYISAY